MHTGPNGVDDTKVNEPACSEQHQSLTAGQILILNTSLNGCDLLIQSKHLQVCSSIPVITQYLHAQMIQAETQQPLLLPVSVNMNFPEAKLTSLETVFGCVQWEVERIVTGNHTQKWILKKVPSTMRSLPWSRVFGQVLTRLKLLQQEPTRDDVYTFLVEELQHIPIQYDSYRHLALIWFGGLTSAQQNALMKSHLLPVQLTLCNAEA
jgi:hypothetical protein